MKNLILPGDILKTYIETHIPNLNTKAIEAVTNLNEDLYKLSGSKSDDFNPTNISKHIDFITNALYDYKNQGFVSSNFLKENSVFSSIALRFNRFKKLEQRQLLADIEYYNDLVLLLLYKDLLLLEILYKPKETDDLFYSTLERKTLLFSMISGDVRLSIKQQRICFNERIYTGFDTEFETIDYGKNKLLCFTTSTFSRFVFIIKTPSLIKTKDLLLESLKYLVDYIRFLKGIDDRNIASLLTFLKVKSEEGLLEVCESENETIFFAKQEISPSNFINRFVDLRNQSGKYSLEELIQTSKDNSFKSLKKQRDSFIAILKLQKDFVVKSSDKTITLDHLIFRQGIPSLFLIAHFSVADIVSLVDFNDFKEKLNIINKTFVTLGKPIRKHGVSFHLRDTSLLSLAGSSLKKLGQLYPSVEKIDIGENIKQMSLFMDKDLDSFRKYAIQDSVLTLYHSLQMEESSIKEINVFKIPITLPSFAGKYMETNLNLTDYSFPTTSTPMQSALEDIPTMYTPKGVEANEKITDFLHYFLGSIHGGRNESFIYGLCKGTFYDYDLPGAYPTAMSLLSYPNYSTGVKIDKIGGLEFLKKFPSVMQSFTALKVSFKFPNSISYPNLPVRLDDSSIIFPLQGTSYCSGLELILAIDLGAEVTIDSGYFIPFKETLEATNLADKSMSLYNSSGEVGLEKQAIVDPSIALLANQANNSCFAENFVKSQSLVVAHLKPQLQDEKICYSYTTPANSDNSAGEAGKSIQEYLPNDKFAPTDFFELVNDLLSKRRSHKPKTYLNLLYKLFANSAIGQMSRGLARKNSFNPIVGTNTVIPIGRLTNPLYAG